MTLIALTIVGWGRFGAADMQSDLEIFKPRNVAPPELKMTRNLAMQTTDQNPQENARAWHVITPGGRHREAAGDTADHRRRHRQRRHWEINGANQRNEGERFGLFMIGLELLTATSAGNRFDKMCGGTRWRANR